MNMERVVVEVKVTGDSFEVLNDAESSTIIGGEENDKDLHSYCAFKIQKGTYLVRAIPGGVVLDRQGSASQGKENADFGHSLQFRDKPLNQVYTRNLESEQTISENERLMAWPVISSIADNGTWKNVGPAKDHFKAETQQILLERQCERQRSK